jgi:hypothetical protein
MSRQGSIPLLVEQAYVVWSHLFFFPAFLEHPERLRPQLSVLAAGDPEYLWEQDDPRILRCAHKNPGKALFVHGLGRVTDGSHSPWVMQKGMMAPASHLGHGAYLIEPNWRLRPTQPVGLLERSYVRLTLHGHIYPYGMCNLMLCLFARFPHGLPMPEFIEFLQYNSPFNTHVEHRSTFEVIRRQARTFVDKTELLEEVADHLGKRLFLEPEECVKDKALGIRHSMIYLQRTSSPMTRDDHLGEMAGLASLTPDWERYGDSFLRRHRGEFLTPEDEEEKYRGDWKVITPGCTVLYTPFLEQRAPVNRRLLLWRMGTAIELARIEAFLYRYFAQELRGEWAKIHQARQGVEEKLHHFLETTLEKRRLVNFWMDLPGFSSGVAMNLAIHRKTYGIAANKMEVAEARQDFQRMLQEFLDESNKWEWPFGKALSALKSAFDIVTGVSGLIT